MKKVTIPLMIAAVVIAIFGLFKTTKSSAEYDAMIYKTSFCGCCEFHAKYLQGDFNVETKDLSQSDLDQLKKKFGISAEVQSCHTTLIENYIVEGHMPKQAIDKLLEDRPNIAGIALPGMPSGSPGMPGEKTEDWVIYTINLDGAYEEYMRL